MQAIRAKYPLSLSAKPHYLFMAKGSPQLLLSEQQVDDAAAAAADRAARERAAVEGERDVVDHMAAGAAKDAAAARLADSAQSCAAVDLTC